MHTCVCVWVGVSVALHVLVWVGFSLSLFLSLLFPLSRMDRMPAGSTPS